jgi:hypothetical protein
MQVKANEMTREVERQILITIEQDREYAAIPEIVESLTVADHQPPDAGNKPREEEFF